MECRLFIQVKAQEWKIIFFIAAGFYFAGNLVFVIFGRGEIQPWNEQQSEKEQSNQTNTKMDIIEFGKRAN